jgi:S1-C subfamily serine protease
VAPTVVAITTKSPSQDLFARFQGRATKSSEGSGVVIDTAGIILTNAHVVSRASRIDVTFADGRSGEATILGVAPDLDLAVLRISDIDGLQAVEIGSSAGLLLGEPVIAIGNPFGLGHTVTTGVVGATSRPLPTDKRVFQNFIQTDASINPGNSGGPLLNANGKLIGINTAIRPDSEGIGFAIPVDRAVKVAKDLVETGVVRIPWLGLTLHDVAFRGVPTQRTAPQIERVVRGGPAEAAGALPGDLILKINDHPIQGRMDLNTYLSGQTDESALKLTISRNEKTQQIELTPSVVTDKAIDGVLQVVLGVRFVEVETAYGTVLQIAGVRSQGAFARHGLRAADICVEVNGTRVTTLKALRRVIRRALSQHRPKAFFYIRRGPSQSGRFHMPL